jgi:hypothetical protein
MKYLLPVLLLLFFSSSFAAPPSDMEIELLFKDNRSVFLELKKLIYTDLGENKSIQVGENVHRKANISDEKLESYALALEKISIERLSAYRVEPLNIQTGFLIKSSGFVFGGCSSEIVHHQEGKPFKRDWADPYKLIELGNGWYAHTLCN